jgi:hypothetical protein
VVEPSQVASDFDTFHSATVRRVTQSLYAMTGDLAEAQNASMRLTLGPGSPGPPCRA